MLFRSCPIGPGLDSVQVISMAAAYQDILACSYYPHILDAASPAAHEHARQYKS